MLPLLGAGAAGSIPRRPTEWPAPTSDVVSVQVTGGLSGEELCRMDVASILPVHMLRSCIANRTGVPPAQQSLVLVASGQPLRDDEVKVCDLVAMSGSAGPADGASVTIALLRMDPARARVVEEVRRGTLEFGGLEEEHRGDVDIAFAAVEHCAASLRFATWEVRRHRALVLAALRLSGLALEYAAEELRDDSEVVLAAIEQDAEALEFASEALRSDAAVVLAAVRRQGCVLRHAAGRCAANRALVAVAVEQDGLALEYAAAELRGDRELILAAVQRNGLALEHSSNALQADPGIVHAALRSSAGLAAQFAAARLRRDRELMLDAVERSGQALRYVARSLQRDRGFVLVAINADGEALEYAAEDLRRDRTIVLAAVRRSGSALRHAAPRLREDRAVVLEALRSHPEALEFAAGGLLEDRELVLLAVRTQPRLVRFASPSILADSAFRVAASELGIFGPEAHCEEYLGVSPKLVHKLLEEGLAVLFDVRNPAEFGMGHIPGAVPFSYQELEAVLPHVRAPRFQKVVVVYSDNGRPYSRCVHLVFALRRDPRLSAFQVLRMAGGLNGWKEQGLAVEGDSRPMVLGQAVAREDLEQHLAFVTRFGVGIDGD